ncbi:MULTISPECIES: DUF3017 domain-containing protein [Bifidobacterium]|uniref:DUF3017 domain-containing protein n=1 Tax=Bifidobacterium TaxID=1678 RepID=UPI001E578F74|nr:MULTISPECIES: DUF3017 domain-containing protein [Bifidobacterium]
MTDADEDENPDPKPPQSARAANRHPFVSEAQEGRPICEGIIFLVVLIAALVAFLGYTWAATGLVSVAALVCGTLRLTLKDRSPWKVRSVPFDVFISIGLGIGLLVTYFSIQLLL